MPTKPITINPKPTPGTLTHELAHSCRTAEQ